MVRMNKILVPVDFSEDSAGAARQAVALARHFHSEIMLLHVQVPLRYPAGSLDGAYLGPAPEVLTERGREDLDRFMADEFDQLPVRRIFSEGDPARRIVELAHQEKVNLIVMPTHGYGPFRRFILGSVTAKVLHDVDSPVWTGVHLEEAPTPEETQIRNVLCAVDLSPHSRATLCWAAQIAAEFGAGLSVVHVTAPLDLTGPGGAYSVPEWRNVLVARANEDVANLQQDLGTRAKVYIESGEVPKVVRQAAAEDRADLLVIGRSPHNGIAGRLRTNAYPIIRESPCPVVSV